MKTMILNFVFYLKTSFKPVDNKFFWKIINILNVYTYKYINKYIHLYMIYIYNIIYMHIYVYNLYNIWEGKLAKNSI